MHHTYNGVPQNPDLPTLVLIHGAGGAHLDWPIPWRNQTRPPEMGSDKPGQGGHVLQTLPVYAVDLPGHGDTPGPGQTSVDGYAQVIADFLEDHDIQNACLVGHSMGAAIAVATALDHGERVGSIALLAGSAKMHVSDDLLKGLQTATEATVAAISKACWFKTTMPMYRETARRRMLSCGAETLHGDFYACSKIDLLDRLPHVDVPALVIASDKDRMVPLADIQVMADAIPNADMQVITDCGHFFHFEKAEELANRLHAFLMDGK